jgi:hypothetical protein
MDHDGLHVGASYDDPVHRLPPIDERRVVQVHALARRWIFERVLQRVRLAPFAFWANEAVCSDAVNPQ